MIVEVSIISARKFSQLQTEEIFDLVIMHDFQWIATTPELQEFILSRLMTLDCNVILEKPLATTSQTWRKVTDLIQSADCRIFYSQPWTFSKLWQRATDEFNKLHFPISINIYKSGQQYRTNFTALQDWLPHDLYLIESLIRNLDISEEGISVSQSQLSNQIKITVGEKLYINFHFDISQHRKMTWEVSSDYGINFVVDFMNNTFEKFDDNEMLLQEIFIGDHPLINMFNQYISEVDHEIYNILPMLQEIIVSDFEDGEIRISL